jgi:hypothetical protein
MRRSGKTTRTVDQAIQKLFTDKKLVIYKNCDNRSDILDPDANLHSFAQKHFLDQLLRRLESEHKGSYEIDNEKNHAVIKIL